MNKIARVKNVINLSDKCIEDIMIPRADIDAVSVDTTYNELVLFIDKTKHSRIPVFDSNLDKVLGMIHIRDLFEKIQNTSCLLYTSPSPRDRTRYRMPSSA